MFYMTVPYFVAHFELCFLHQFFYCSGRFEPFLTLYMVFLKCGPQLLYRTVTCTAMLDYPYYIMLLGSSSSNVDLL